MKQSCKSNETCTSAYLTYIINMYFTARLQNVYHLSYCPTLLMSSFCDVLTSLMSPRNLEPIRLRNSVIDVRQVTELKPVRIENMSDRGQTLVLRSKERRERSEEKEKGREKVEREKKIIMLL